MKEILPAQEDIAALIPSYTTKGDCTTLLTRDGETRLIALRLRTILSRLARARATDLAMLKRHSTASTRRSILQPLPLSPELLLFPVKVRVPRIAGDTCTGYINYHTVAQVLACIEKPAHSRIILIGGQSVQALWTTATVNRYLQLAQLAAYSAPVIASRMTREKSAIYEPELLGIAHKLVEVFQEILMLRQGR